MVIDPVEPGKSGGALELDIELFSEHGPASQNRQITEDRFTVISNSMGFKRHDLQPPMSLLKIQAANASPSISLAMMTNGHLARVAALRDIISPAIAFRSTESAVFLT